MYKIGVIGDKDSVLFFRALGLDVYPVEEDAHDSNRKLVDRLAREDYGILFLTEQVAATMPETLVRYRNRMTPGIILIPSGAGTLGIGRSNLRDNMERAVGINVLDESRTGGV